MSILDGVFINWASNASAIRHIAESNVMGSNMPGSGYVKKG